MSPETVLDAPPVVLVVDDEPFILKNLEVLLSGNGCKVRTAATGSAGLEIAMKERPDVVLLDVMLPDTDGYEVCRKIKQEPATRHIPVLLLTALQDVFSKVKGLDAGADDFVSKPFNESELRARVWAFLRTKRLHDELDNSYKRLKELEELRDSLTHMVMHDLVAPLTAIQVGVEAVLEKGAPGTPITESNIRMLRTAHEGCRRLMDMLRDVLSVSRLEEKKLPLALEKVEMKPLVETCVSILEPTRLLGNVNIATRFSEPLKTVVCDPSLMTRVVTNLISNSLKFTEPGGTVTVSAATEGKEAEVAVADTGLGIPKENLEKIFDKFFQGGEAQTARKGQGLGLTFCRLAVEAHGGRIWAESEPGKGSRFVLRLPLETKAS
ncbi:MAG: hybrid sensor histidine kinase/response regulator [Elusimicrobia bacterium]|nr:hybrid sensor histidine kinase/response regulator [Elusimicrobiota bacterium]